MASLPKVAIIELGSQYTLLIERTARELGVRSAILNPKQAASWLERHEVDAVILSGGQASVYDADAPEPPKYLLQLQNRRGSVAVLGICYGMQWLVRQLGGEVRSIEGHREYGRTEIRLEGKSHKLFTGTPERQIVWASHGDSVTRTPVNFEVLARARSGAITAMSVSDRIVGVQFHPEVTQTGHGKAILGNFLFEIARCEKDWQPSSMGSAIRSSTVDLLRGRKAVIGFSGGVDSTTLSAILSSSLGDNLLAVTIDGGHLREGELYEISDHARHAGVTHRVVDARKKFTEVMAGIVDAGEKRRRFKPVYAGLLANVARDFGASTVIQGTLAPDRIESGATGGANIKDHHNIGLDFGPGFDQIHSIDHLFKYEVRALAAEVGLPDSVSKRQPFPGPGLFLRVLNTPATPKALEIVRWADAKATEILKKHGFYDNLSQLVVAYVGVNTVGVKGDARVYQGVVVVRAVQTVDFMTAEGVWFPEEVVADLKAVLPQHADIGRVWFDPTDKPPATTEFE